VDAARLLLDRAAADADRGVCGEHDVARLARDHALAADLLASTVAGLFRLTGTSAHDREAPLQRFWRDVTTAAGHAVLRFEPAARAYARLVVEGCR
ncbi:MAG: hydrolase, partial [Saccharothrix sp.]|nr:hydrolase [Saccharothrix sp.]